MLRRLLGRGTPLTPPAPLEPPAVAARWEELLRGQPELASGIALIRAVQRLQRDAALDAAPPPIAEQAGRDRLAAGVPLLFGASPFVAAGAVAALVRALAAEAVSGAAVAEARAVCAALDAGVFDLPRAVAAACALDGVALSALLAGMGEAAPLAETLVHYALAPAFRAAAERYAPLIVSTAWPRGVCPVCAAPPVLGELRGGESRRVLRCGRCGAAWPYQRLRCVYCGTGDHRKLSSLHAEGEGEFLRVELCDVCRGYIKSLARLDPIAYELLPAEDLATAALDLAAIERGYARPGGTV